MFYSSNVNNIYLENAKYVDLAASCKNIKIPNALSIANTDQAPHYISELKLPYLKELIDDSFADTDNIISVDLP